MIHPFTGDAYERAEGAVRVVRHDREGLFTWDGRWISGDLRQADPNMCIVAAGGYGGPALKRREPKSSTNADGSPS